jgi:hypothetical protein
MKKFIIMAGVFLFCIQAGVNAGQNSGAGISIDLDYTTVGNQGQTSIPPPGVGANIYLEVRISGASNLDTYEFNLNYPNSDLTYMNAWADNFPPSNEQNILKNDGAGIVGPEIDTSTPGVLNFSLTNDTDDPAKCPEGEGLLAVVHFQTKVASPGKLTFGDVFLYDNAGNKDICTDKGEASLPVQMSELTAFTSHFDGITIQWRTASEVDCAGFHVWRSESEKGEYFKITSTLIPSRGTLSSAYKYCYTDRNVKKDQLYWYKVEEVSSDGKSEFFGPISVEGVTPIPTEFSLSQNYPNPFNPMTTFEYQLPKATHVTIRIFDLLGKEVAVLVNKRMEPDCYSIQWDGTNGQGNPVSSGIYFVQMQAGDFSMVRKLSVMR